jgi:hypothetical protein
MNSPAIANWGNVAGYLEELNTLTIRVKVFNYALAPKIGSLFLPQI